MQCKKLGAAPKQLVDALGAVLMPALAHLDNALSSFVMVFTVDEVSKVRRRHIFEPILNDLINLIQSMRFIRRYSVLLVASSFFDQFGLAPAVSKYFCIHGPGGKVMSWRTLSMGFNKSCLIAQLTAEWLIDLVDMKSVSACPYINFLFSADSRAELLAAVRTFRMRCAAVGVILNEAEDTACASNSNVSGHSTTQRTVHMRCGYWTF